jgi:hypothetical protein
MRAPQAIGRETQLGVLVGALALISVAALVGQIYGIVDMTFVLAFLALPAAIVIVGIARWSVKADYRLFYRRLVLGIALGLAATVAYDLVRLAAQTALPLDFNAFAIHARFGELIIDQPRDSTAARVVGWSYHISNGLTFALCYTLVAGRARWWWGLLYGLTLESLMVVMYPTGFGLSRGNEDFLIVSFLGHATYGSVLGLLNYRFNENEPSGSRVMPR